MTNALSSLFSDDGVNLRAKVIGIYVLLIGANIAAWLWALSAFRDFPILLGTAMLAYTFGLRHRDRQRDPEADAGRKAAGRGRLLLFARSFDHRCRAFDRNRRLGDGAQIQDR
jgi:hypothetical protein